MYRKKIDHFNENFKRLFWISNCQCRLVQRGAFMVCEINRKSIRCETPYTICINYEQGWAPRVWIVEPDLTMVQYLPHVYSQKFNQLCLFHKSNFQWSVNENIIDTIVYWSMAWFEFYESWKETGIWFGPEVDHALLKPEVASNGGTNPVVTKVATPQFLKDQPIRY